MASILDRCVQLITQSNDCCLLADFEARKTYRHIWDMSEFSKYPENPVYLTPNGRAFAEEEPWISNYKRNSRKPFYYIQAIKTIYLTESAFAYKEPYTFYSDYQGSRGKDLFLQFASLKTKEKLEEFIKDKKDFCIFPDENDLRLLSFYYTQEIKTARFIFSHYMTDQMPDDENEIIEIIKSKIRAVNLDFLWEKQQRFKNLLELYKNGKMEFSNISWIHYYLEQVSDIFLDKKSNDISKIEKSVNFKYPHDTRSFYEIKGFRKIDDAGLLVPAYRVYGHFALCCLQFYLLVRNQMSVDICPECKSYYQKTHKKQQSCENCKKKAASKRTKKYQSKKKKG